MLELEEISLLQFKNYGQLKISVTSRVLAICGKNGIGKTNLLDAVYYACFTRSYFGRQDVQHVQYGSVGFRLDVRFKKNAEAQLVTAILRENGKKEIAVNGISYTRMAEHIGLFPCVMIAPDDVEIISGASELRRRFLDALLSQLSQEYLNHLIVYNRVLLQRNSQLKICAAENRPYTDLLDVLDEQLVREGLTISHQRHEFLQRFIPVAAAFYKQISGEAYRIMLNYETQVNGENYRALLKGSRVRDLALQRTNIGVHRDDIGFLINDRPFRQVASQGQRKSLLFALKLAEYSTLRSAKGFAPILLLDDVFEKLDAVRMSNLLQWVCQQNEGQVLLTDTHCERLQQTLTDLHTPFQLISL